MSKTDIGKNFIEHHGIKGQKWGVRRSRRQLARAAGVKGRSAKDMTDEELRTAVNRMNMEQQYSRLSSGSGSGRNRTAIAVGSSFLGGIAMNTLRSQIQTQTNQRVGRAIATRTAREAAVSRLRRLG